MSRRVGWRFAVEPIGQRFAWSLFTSTADDEINLVDAGIVPVRPGLDAQVLGLVGANATSGALMHRDLERQVSQELGEIVLPPSLRLALHDESTRHTLSISARGWLTRLPWAALQLSDGRRLIEAARLLGAIAPGIVSTRRRPAAEFSGAPGMATIDPGPLDGAAGPIYPGGLPGILMDEDGLAPDDLLVLGPTTPGLVGEQLRSDAWSRWLYVGHLVGGSDEAPAAASLVLAEDGGSGRMSARSWLAEPDRWPVPSRVALIGCQGDDPGHAEQAGLVTAAVNAGAGLVTTTLWPLPTDAALGNHALSRLALAVHHAHQAPDPVDSLRAWQLDRLDAWRRVGNPWDSPLLWAALTTVVAEDRND